jgi:hypothetical protein
MGPVKATIRRIRVCGPAPILGHTQIRVQRNLDSPHFDWSILPISARKHALINMIPACCPQAWDHVGVMVGAVKMFDAGGIGAGNPQLGRLKKP